jgi:LPXTG-site transpeptidase (sortase) family protein
VKILNKEQMMENSLYRLMLRTSKPVAVVLVLCCVFSITLSVFAEASIPQTDQTPINPLSAPNPAASWPRYISGFGSNNSYTLFYEDRNDTVGCGYGWRIYFNQTTTGSMGFAATSTATDICDTHLIVKNWPITISGYGTFNYRAWGAHDNDPIHTFYVSNNLVNWTRIFMGDSMFSDPSNIMLGETINYGFHDIVQLNGNYMGFVESAGGNTYIAWSDNGDNAWTIVAKVGGSESSDLPLSLSFTSAGPIPTGNFLLMYVDGQLVYGKLMVPGNRSGVYLAINAEAAQAATPALAEAAFINPSNWTWQDGSTGQPNSANAILLSTLSSGGHDIREVFSAPTSSPRSDNVIMYTANFAGGGATRGIGCASSSSECLVVLPPDPTDIPPVLEPTPIVFLSTSLLPIPLTGFTPGKISQPVLPELRYQDMDLNLVIPSIGINNNIVGVSQENGSWDVSWLGESIGYLNGTAFPTWNGNSVLTGHVYNADGLPGIFADLEDLKWGDQVIVQFSDQNYIFEVRQVKTIDPTNSTYVFKHEDQPWLTLITCKGFNEVTESYQYRTVVKAVLIKIEPIK